MSDNIDINLTQPSQPISVVLNEVDQIVSIDISQAGQRGISSVTSQTTSDGTADLYLETISFNTANGGPTDTGEISWMSTDGTLDLMLENDVVLAVGENGLIRIRNTSGDSISKGDALVYTGTTGNTGRINVAKWESSNVTDVKTFMGFASGNMENNTNGYATWFGKLDSIDTSGTDQGESWSDGDILYALPGSPATLSTTAPTHGAYASAAVIIRAHDVTGRLFARPSFHFAYGEFADDTAAASGGVAIGGIYRKSDGTVVWRQS